MPSFKKNNANSFAWTATGTVVGTSSGGSEENNLVKRFVATASGDSYLLSEDGDSWTRYQFNLSGNPYLQQIVYGNNKFVTIGNAADGSKSAVSTDGLSWTLGTMPYNFSWSSIAYGDSKFVAVGSYWQNSSAVSTDGITWSGSGAYVFGPYYSPKIAYGNGRFVVSQFSGSTSYFYTSTDGLTWTWNTVAAMQLGQATITSIHYAEDKFVAIDASGKVFYSSDGIADWSETNYPTSGAANFSSMTYGNGSFLAVERATMGVSNKAISSEDGTVWSAMTFGTAGAWSDVVYGNGKFIVAGEGGILSAPDFTSGWTYTSTPDSVNLFSIAYGEWPQVVI